MTEPTPSDMACDLRQVLADVTRHGNHVRAADLPHLWPHLINLVSLAVDVLPKAIRRCLAAEARAAELERDLADARRVAQSLADRAAAQSELLSQRAEVPDLRALVVEMRRYIRHHGLLMGECVAWGKLKDLTGVGQDRECPSEKGA